MKKKKKKSICPKILSKKLGGFTHQNFLKKKLGGFTVLELLVVIAIFGLLTSLIFVHLRDAKAMSRDGKRKGELDTLRKALAIYYEYNGEYPKQEDQWIPIEDTFGEPGKIAEEIRPYVSDVPEDPLYGEQEIEEGKTYAYWYITADDGQGYTVCAQMERGIFDCRFGIEGKGSGVEWGKGGPDKNYSYRMPIIITENSGNDLTNYQVSLTTIDTQTLILDGEMKESDCADITFTESDGVTEIPFWMEPGTCDTDSTKIWTKVPSLPASADTTIYMYYGYLGAESKSDYAATFPWITENVGTSEGYGRTSISLNKNNYPSISYRDNITKKLKYIDWQGIYWRNATTVDAVADAYEPKLVLNKETDEAHIYYYDNKQWEPMYAKKNGSDWEITNDIEETNGGGYLGSIDIDSNGLPHIAYPYGGLKYAWFDGADWQKETLENCCVGTADIALDNNNYPHIAYKYNKGYLRYIKKTETGWTVPKEIDIICSEYSISVDKNNNPAIAYYTSDFLFGPCASLGYAQFNESTGWTTSTIDTSLPSLFSWSMLASLTFDLDSNTPHIAYQSDDSGNSILKYACDKNGWKFETGIDDCGANASIDLDLQGFPHISFTNQDNFGEIKHAYRRKYIDPWPTYLLKDEEKL